MAQILFSFVVSVPNKPFTTFHTLITNESPLVLRRGRLHDFRKLFPLIITSDLDKKNDFSFKALHYAQVECLTGGSVYRPSRLIFQGLLLLRYFRNGFYGTLSFEPQSRLTTIPGSISCILSSGRNLILANHFFNFIYYVFIYFFLFTQCFYRFTAAGLQQSPVAEMDLREYRDF